MSFLIESSGRGIAHCFIPSCRFVSELKPHSQILTVAGIADDVCGMSGGQDAAPGEVMRIHICGDVCVLELGEDVKKGAWLRVGFEGRGLLDLKLEHFVAYAEDSGSKGQKIRVTLTPRLLREGLKVLRLQSGAYPRLPEAMWNLEEPVAAQ